MSWSQEEDASCQNPALASLPFSEIFSSLCPSHDSEQVRLYQRSQVWSPEADKTSIQGMIDANKRWLENFKKDSKVYPLPRYGLHLCFCWWVGDGSGEQMGMGSQRGSFHVFGATTWACGAGGPS